MQGATGRGIKKFDKPGQSSQQRVPMGKVKIGATVLLLYSTVLGNAQVIPRAVTYAARVLIRSVVLVCFCFVLFFLLSLSFSRADTG